MPKCKNDKSRNYKGTEPSPKGLGYCAHSEKLNKKMKGRDGNIWIIQKTSKGVKRWVKNSKEKNNFDILNKKLIRWWQKLSNGYIIIIFNNDKHILKKYNKTKWENLEADKNIKAILWSSISIDTFEQFLKFILNKNKKNINEFMNTKNIPNVIIKNYKIYFKKHKLYTKKDYTLKQKI